MGEDPEESDVDVGDAGDAGDDAARKREGATPDDAEPADGGGEPATDPFEALDGDVGDRDGDPFERLAGPDEGGDGDEGSREPGTDDAQPPGPGAAPGDAPSDPLGGLDDLGGGPRDVGRGEGAGPGTDDVVEGDIATDTASDIASTGSADEARSTADSDPAGRGDPFESGQTAFREMDVADLDADQVWRALDEAEERGSVTRTRERTYAEVSKHAYCEGCEWFSDPPEAVCGHDGTEIIEFPDVETVRVVDCPVVAERRELGEGE
jgi:hypothetical protein